MATTVVMPEFGITGLPAGTKDNVRADLRAFEFEKLIEVKGYRLAWSRASLCPCKSVNDQTQQVDPNCTLCKGKGWLYFGPEDYVANPDVVGALTATQKLVIADSAIIKGIMNNLMTNLQPFTPVGHWLAGTSSLTVRHENRLGYYDKIVGLDSELVYSEKLTAIDPTLPLGARYPIISVNFLRSLSTRYDENDFGLVNGKIVWVNGRGPAMGTLLAIHYQTFPTWIIIDHPHTVRDTRVKFKTPNPETYLGSHKKLPIQALVKYDFLLD